MNENRRCPYCGKLAVNDWVVQSRYKNTKLRQYFHKECLIANSRGGNNNVSEQGKDNNN